MARDREEPSEDGDRDSGDYEAAGEVRVGLRAWSGPLGHTRKSALYPTPRYLALTKFCSDQACRLTAPVRRRIRMVSQGSRVATRLDAGRHGHGCGL